MQKPPFAVESGMKLPPRIRLITNGNQVSSSSLMIGGSAAADEP
jgi:hypothetical protein